jgi:hypothetical protein
MESLPKLDIYEPEAVYGPGRRYYHSVRADLFTKTAQFCLTNHNVVGYHHNMKEAGKHRELAGQLLMEEGINYE